MRKMATGVIVIVLLTVAAIAAIWALTRDAGPGPSAGLADGPSAPASTYAPPPLPTLPPAPAGPAPEPVVVYGPPKVEPPSGSWEAVAVAARPAALGPLGGAIGRGLNEIQSRLSACFDEDTAARFGSQPRSLSRDASLPEGSSTPVLVLQIETGSGDVRIVDAPVDAQGTASDGVIACAQSVLRGRRFAFPQAVPGQRYRLLYSLIP